MAAAAAGEVQVPEIVGATAYDALWPSALLRVTFDKAHWWHTADEFAEASKTVYNQLSTVANLYPATKFPLVTDARAWTIDVRTPGNGGLGRTDRTVAEILQAIALACNVRGVDFVEVSRIQVLSQNAVKQSNNTEGAQQRAAADANAAANAASNPLDALNKAANDAKKALGEVGKFALLAILGVIIVLVLMQRKR